MWAVIVPYVVSAFKWLADKAITIGLVIYHATIIVGQALLRFGGAVAGIFGKAWDLLGRFWSRVLKPFVSWSWTQIQRLHTWLEKTMRPVLAHLVKWRAQLLAFYAKWFRPIFDTLDVMRSLLRVLETFHIAWAQKLDAELAALESRLLYPIRIALQTINELTNWINRIVDFDGLFQRLTLIASLVKYSRDSWNVLLHPQVRGLSSQEKAARAGQTYERNDPAAAGAALGELYMANDGALAPVVSELVPVWFAASGLQRGAA